MPSPTLTSEVLALLPPPAPVQTHREERNRLPAFPAGSSADRKDRSLAYLEKVGKQIEALHGEGASGLSIARLISEGRDRLLIGLWRELFGDRRSGICLVALGGYGRRELAPHSDLDLLLLRGTSASEKSVAPLAESLHTLLWDLNLAVGWSVRTAAECARAAEEDHTIRTALLDCRYLAGDAQLYARLAEHALRDLLSRRADAFIADKAQELTARRQKYGDSIYVLEPNLKQGEGGLRDLQAALWIAQARFRARGLTELLQQSVLPRSEVDVLAAARDFMLRIRNHLHYLRGSKEDRLTFDLQEEVAAYLGYRNSERGLAVEQFMRHYYLAAKAIRRVAEALIARCEEIKQRRGPFLPERRLGPFKVFRGKLTLDGEPEMLTREPELVLKLFRVADEEELPLYSWAKDQVVQALPALSEARGNPAVTEEVRKLFQRPDTHGQFLFETHELGVLGTVLPEFGRVTALHQHDLYHVYTVDVHTLFALRRLYALRAGDLVEHEPQLTRQMRDLEDPLPLYLGMLLHDAGKGMGGDHSQRGAELADQLGDRLKLTDRQKEISRFLVLEHLLMSHTAQRRDLSDPHLIADFAERVGDLEKLRCLYLLTYADISSVGPERWTEWKAQLLKQLFDKAREHLSTQVRPTAEDLVAAARQEFFRGWESELGSSQAEAFGRVLPPRYFLSADPANASSHARLLLRARRQPLATSLRHREELRFSEVTLCAADQPGLLAKFAGVLAAHRIDILRAQITSTTDGFALDIFDTTALGGHLVEPERWEAARADLVRVITGEANVEGILEKRRAHRVLNRPLPSVPTKVSVDNRGSRHFSVIDVRAEDRIGLLYVIASQLTALQLEIALAKVATEAHRAIDSFYVTSAGEKLTDPEQIEATLSALRRAIDAFAAGSSTAA